MSRVTLNDLRKEIGFLNKKFKKTNKTAVKFDISSAYGGHQIVLKDNRSGGVKELTYGHNTPKETIKSLEKKSMSSIRYDLNNFHKHAMSYRRKK
jgi:hypothetical protein